LTDHAVGTLHRFQVLVPRTLRGRLVAAAAGSILAAVVLFSVATVALVYHELRGSLDSALRSRAQDVGQLAVSAPAVLTRPGALESPVSGRQIAVEVIDARGRILARSETLGARLLPEDRLADRARIFGRPGYEDLSIGGRQFRLYAAPIASAGGPAAGGAVLVASDTTDINSTAGHLGFVLALTGAVVAVAAALLAAVLTRRGLAPLRRLAGAAGEIERTADHSRRLPTTAAPDEIGALTGVLNRMLASLERAQATERRFLADASHELRTPVTALLGNVEYAARHGADPEVLEDLRRDADRLARLVDGLLVLERAAGGIAELVPVELGSLASSVVASKRDPRVRLGSVQPARILADGDALARAIANLIENGLVHGPAGGSVTVTVSVDAGWARLSVRDEGQGPDPGEHDLLTRRFWRAPTAAERPGSGLGLSIVAAIVERHSGRLAVEAATFTLELPLVS
jgi:signal transduction histidine kinase